MAAAMIQDIQPGIPLTQIIDKFVRNILRFVREQTAYFLFIEQFSNSPLVDLCQEELDNLFHPLWNVFSKGIENGELKQTMPNMLMTYCYQPVTYCAKMSVQRNIPITESLTQQIVQMSWDAIKI
jgi:hypothetical protein